MEDAYGELLADAEKEVLDQGVHPQRVTRVRKAQLRYEGTDSPLPVDYGSLEEMQAAFEATHRQRFGFVAVEPRLVVGAVAVEVICATEAVADPERAVDPAARGAARLSHVSMHSGGPRPDAPLNDTSEETRHHSLT